ncbi:MAG: MBL fold metallo-hydrolase [Clostridiales bacterium]|nr:MBL fold metallo-hydrolase [Clostridiales bacterium]
MKITFLGATHEVTGSCTYIEVNGKKILVDCGMEQGADIFENQEIPVNPSEIDCVLLTHAHIDHSGNLPLLYKNGFRGHIYATTATCMLAKIMLLDSAHIQMFEAQWRSRKGKRSGAGEYQPIYDTNDAQGAISKFVACEYGTQIEIFDGLKIAFTDIGHLLGSASIEVWLTEDGVTKKIVFSGDVGNIHQPILQDPKYTHSADYVVVESTYGDRYHPERLDYIASLTRHIQRTLDRGGNVIIPSFAVGRTQELLYFIRQIKHDNLIKDHPDFQVYIDSPLAIEATNIFLNCSTEYFDDETKALIDKGINPLTFPGLQVAVTSEESKLINSNSEPKVIISASGMCEAGRIRHHLKHNLWREECLILFVGYQAQGTLGRTLLEGADHVKLFGEQIAVNAEIEFLEGISGHADKEGLIKFIQAFDEKPHTVFVNHGEDNVCKEFTACLHDEYGYNAYAPYSGTCVDLISGKVIKETLGIRAKKAAITSGQSRSAAVFNRLLAACNRLLSVARRCEGMANKDIAKFADQIDTLSDKWSR